MNCPHCKQSLPDGLQACFHCGKPLTGRVAPPMQTQPVKKKIKKRWIVLAVFIVFGIIGYLRDNHGFFGGDPGTSGSSSPASLASSPPAGNNTQSSQPAAQPDSPTQTPTPPASSPQQSTGYPEITDFSVEVISTAGAGGTLTASRVSFTLTNNTPHSLTAFRYRYIYENGDAPPTNHRGHSEFVSLMRTPLASGESFSPDPQRTESTLGVPIGVIVTVYDYDDRGNMVTDNFHPDWQNHPQFDGNVR